MFGQYNHNFSPARLQSSSLTRPNMNNPDADDNPYLTQLFEEYQKLGPFMQVLPICSRLLNQGEWILDLRRDFLEILRVSGTLPNKWFNDFSLLQCRSPRPMASVDIMLRSRGASLSPWYGLSLESLGERQGTHMDWQAAPTSPSSYSVKKIVRFDIPVDRYPNFNFVGRLLGPRGNSLKRMEATTGCRIYIRGKGSVKDPDKEELLRGKPGYEHLNDPLHLILEADLPGNIIDVRLKQAQDMIEELLKPVDDMEDLYKKEQLRELAVINGTLREDIRLECGSMSPFTSTGMKRTKAGQ